MPKRVILDTDIGTDVDDVLALSLILSSPELSLEGVTCVYGDVLLRARMVRKLLALRGRDEVPVFAGARKPLLGLRPVFWAGHEGKGLLEPEDEALAPEAEHAANYIVRTVMENPGQIYLAAVGPLTNVALAFLLEPRLAENLAGLTIMGGAIRAQGNLDLPVCEHNIRCDPEAAHIVLSAGAPVTLVPLDVTTRVRLDGRGLAQIRAGGTPFHEAVAHQVELYPHFREHGWTLPHDPLAVATLIVPEVVDLEALHIDVEMGGAHTAGATLARKPAAGAEENARVALTVDSERFNAFLPARIGGDATPKPL